MKKLYVIGNLKMNLTLSEIVPYLNQLKELAKNANNFVGVCVPSVYLPVTQQVLSGSSVLYGVQNMFFEKSGAYTGEISADMVKDFNAKLVIVGHSERRNLFGETDEMVSKKLNACLQNDLIPILCVGETKDEHNKGLTNAILKRQLITALSNISKDMADRIIIAYEPIWAIGTGVSATPDDAEKSINFIKQVCNELFGSNLIKVLYGGSVNSTNAKDIFSMPHIDGGLVGGASLIANTFYDIFKIEI